MSTFVYCGTCLASINLEVVLILPKLVQGTQDGGTSKNNLRKCCVIYNMNGVLLVPVACGTENTDLPAFLETYLE